MRVLRRLVLVLCLLMPTGCADLAQDVPPSPGGQLPGEGESVATGDRTNGNPPEYPDQSADPTAYESFEPPIVLAPAPEANLNREPENPSMPEDPSTLGQMGIQLSQTLVHLPGVAKGSVFLTGTTAHVALVADGTDRGQVEDVIRSNLRMAEPRITEMVFYWDEGATQRFLEGNQRLRRGENPRQVADGLGLGKR